MSIDEFEKWITSLRLARTIVYLQMHHTYSPNYALFKGNNHFELQRGMKNHHVNNNGWADIGQHFTIFPDGVILTGRSLEESPACIFGNNANAICIEHLGNFDKGGDTMNEAQKNSILRATAAICKKFSIPVNTDKIVYHHWFNLSTGERNNGSGGNKSCPGTNFFGGNKVADCQKNFLPLVNALLSGSPANEPAATVLKYVCVNANSLNIRKGPAASFEKAADREPATLGAILRVFKVQNGWYKIAGSKQHWVSAQYTTEVKRAVVNADTLNVRNAPDASALALGAVMNKEEVFVFEERNGWTKISLEEKWVKSSYLKLLNV